MNGLHVRRMKQVVDRGIVTMGLIRSIYFAVIAVAFIEGRSSYKNTSNSVLVWWQKKPLVFTTSGGKSPADGGPLGGLLPEIWPTVANRCREFLPRSYTDGYRHHQIAKPLSKLEFAQVMGPGDLLMPIKLRKSKETVLGMPFVKLLDSPGVAVIIKKALTGTDLFNAILMAWPILMFVVLSALLSGFFMWFLEYRSNPQMFDSFCPKGVLNGFWWAAVTMTTVGYGDITPKTILGRLFTIVWISVGLVILAMYMGVVTTSLTTTRLEGTQHFYGITVAAVNQTEEHRFAILQNTHIKVQEDELQVIDAIYNRKDGVKLGFVDFYLASYHSDIMHKKKLDIVRIIPRQHAYGVLLGKDWSPEVVDCLRRHSGDNHHVIHKLIPKYIVGSEHKQRLTEYFSDSLFGYSIYVLSGCLCLLIFLGLCHGRCYCAPNDKD